jgi:hypothetical protein
MTEQMAKSGTDVQRYLASEKRLRMITLGATILPLAVFLTLIGLTVREKNKFINLREQNADLIKQISDNQSKLDKMKADISYYASQVTPSVDIEFANERQRSKAAEVAEHLKKLGYDVTVDDEPLGTRITQNTYVRYFFGNDEPLARQVQEQVKSLGINAEVQSFADESNRESLGYVRPKALELWLGKRYVPIG